MDEIRYAERGAGRENFHRTHWLHFPGAEAGRHMFATSGIVVVGFTGDSPQWKRSRIRLLLQIPDGWIPPQPPPPPGQHAKQTALLIEHCAPFVTINAIFNPEHAVNAGWAVDDFGLYMPEGKKSFGGFEIWADVAVSDAGGILYRIAYNVAIQGWYIPVDFPDIK